MEQSYSNLEIILVDDGGSDRCSEILDLYASKDNRIRVIHKPNGGLVSARQAGLKAATGTYILCVDGDDWIAPGYLETMVTAAMETEADIVCAGFSRDRFMRMEEVREHWPVGGL